MGYNKQGEPTILQGGGTPNNYSKYSFCVGREWSSPCESYFCNFAKIEVGVCVPTDRANVCGACNEVIHD